jgi:hypothetical protein
VSEDQSREAADLGDTEPDVEGHMLDVGDTERGAADVGDTERGFSDLGDT